jgi:hypothetical protein
MSLIVRYSGWPGTGLRLEHPDDMYHSIDVGGTHGKGPMELGVGGGKGDFTKIDLEPEDVAQLAKHCNEWLAWRLAGRPEGR